MRCILVLLLMFAAQAQAGPWPREKGGAFLSYGGQFKVSRIDGLITNYSTVYGEYGLREKLTLGIDLGGDNGRAEKAIGFLRFPVWEADSQTKFAVEIGAGQVENELALRPGFSVGRGLNIGKRSGWATIDTRLNFFPNGDDPELEADFTIGIAATKRLKLIAQLQTGMVMGRSGTISFAPSVVFETKPGQHIELGLIAGIRETTAYGFKLNFWRSF